MSIEPLASNESSNEMLFESFIIKNLNSFEELIGIYQTYKQNNADKTIILTLDDLGQAEYTSTHSIMFNDLDETDGYDLSGLDQACFENGEHLGYLSTPSEFFIRKENFLKQTSNIDFKLVCDNEITIDEDEISVLTKINQAPLAYLDKEILLKVVPVTKPYEGICGFPNGYFSSDLNPFQNYAIAKHLFEKYDFELFGIGAALLGFYRNEKLEENKVKELIADLSNLYNTTATAFDKFADSIKDKNYLFLKYIEYLEY